MSKTYHITTIANLLLDMDFCVSDQFLADNGLNKGVQTMVDESQHHALLRSLKGINVQYAAGGACTNSVFAASCLGAKTFVNGRIGDDQPGDDLLKSLQSSGITTPPLTKLRTEGHTGKCILLVTPDAERTMMTHLGISATIPMSCVEIDSLLETEYFLVEGFQCIPEGSRSTNIKAMQMAHSAGAKIALSLCDEAVADYFYDQVQEFLAAAPIDILFCNQFEAMSLTKTTTVNDAMSGLQKMAKQVVITKGSDGASIWNGELFEVKGIATNAVDSTGAGDIFVGTFLWALTHQYSHEHAAKLANAAAARLVSKVGPRLSKDELAQVFSQTDTSLFVQREPSDALG